MRFRITVREAGTELRGYLSVDDMATLQNFAAAMKPYGVVIASPADDDYDPFAEDDRP